jgi:peptide/nickel transport system substrate-binding protein
MTSAMSHRRTFAPLIVGGLVALHLLVAFAGFVAPYDPASQDRSLPYAPPTALHVADVNGVLHSPFVYAQVPDPNDPARYIDDMSRRYPVQVLANGHLLSVEAPARLSLLGTDGFGRDVFSRLLHGGRVSVAAGLLATLCALLVGMTLGTLAGFLGGLFDRVLMRAADVFMALPWIYLLFAVRAALPLHIDTRATFLMLVAVLGVVGWARPARMIRGIVLSARERTYVRAAEGFGASPGYLLRRHILPHTYNLVLTQASVLIPQYLLAEVALSFLGLGIGEPTASWGSMLGTLQQYHVLTSYWWMFAPAVALATIALAYHALTALVQERARVIAASVLILIALGAYPAAAAPPSAPRATGEDVLVLADTGTHGGRLVVALRAEPRTLNPVVAIDAPSKDVIGRMTGNLIQINRLSQGTESALAKSWKRSSDGLTYTLSLRRGVRFSDGHPFDADDVVFTFKVLLDPVVGAPHHDLLVVGGKPIAVTKVDAYTVRLTLAEPYAAAERLFDGVAILPRHLLESAYAQGKLGEAWSMKTASASIAGLGPYRLKHYVAGQELVFERNPYYWKVDSTKRRLPYLDEIVFVFAGNEDAQVIRFQGGESDLLGRTTADNFALLSRDQAARRYQLKDLGPSLEYNFLVFNQNDLTGRNLPHIAAKQRWFGDVNFRRAVSLAIDRQGITRLIFKGRAVPLWGNVSPGNRQWVNTNVPRPSRSVANARESLKASGFSWRTDGSLVDKHGQRVEFTIVSSATSAQRTAMATLIQADLEEIGIDVRVVPLEFRALIDRVFETFDYEASVQGLGGGDADPNAEMSVWLSRGANHMWRLGQKAPATTWETEIDRLMQQQLSALDPGKRKAMYDRVQTIVAEQLPFIFLAAPHILVAARGDLANFQPAVLDHYTLWNADRLYFRPQPARQPGLAGQRR